MEWKDIKPNTLVTLLHHNGRGRENTYTKIYVSRVCTLFDDPDKNGIVYDTHTGSRVITKYELESNNLEIVDIQEVK